MKPVESAPKRAIVRLETEQRELFSISRSERTLRILHRISLRSGKLRELARNVFYVLKDTPEGGSLQVDPSYFDSTRELAAALRYEVDSERLLYGEEDVPERQEFLRNRQNTQEHIRELKLRLGREQVNAETELLNEREKRESVLYQDVNQVLQDVARELGFQRPVALEISRTPMFNAFILRMAKEGQDFSKPSAEPIHVFVNAGLIRDLDKMFQEEGMVFTKDHLAGILGHELKHLTQPEYDLDDPGSQGAEVTQRHEYDADVGGFEAADHAGYNPRATIETYQMVAKKMGKGWQEAFNHYFQRTHPMSENRVKNLLEEYHRGDRILYSATAEYQPFSAGALDEAKNLVREELHQKLAAARSLDDWHTILDGIEHDPRATVRDMEVAMNYYKMHLDVRSAVAIAVRELRTGELGLRDAVLYTLNAYASGQPLHFDLLEGQYEIQVPDLMLKDLLPVVSQEALSDLEQEYDPSIVHTSQIKEIVDFTYEQTLMAPLEQPTFASLEEALDPSLWPDQLVRRFSGKTRAEMFNFLIEQIATRILAGANAHTTFLEDDIDLKEAILKAMREVPGATAEESGPDVNEAFPKDFSGIRKALERRVSSSGIQLGRGPDVSIKRPRSREYRLIARPFHSPVPVDEGVAQTTPLNQLTARFLQIARSQFEIALGPERSRELTGQVIPNVPAVQDWLFKRYYHAFLFKLPDPEFPIRSLSELREWGVLPEYVRLLPLHLRRLASPRPDQIALRYLPGPDYPTQSMVGQIAQGQFFDEMNTLTLKDLGDQLHRIRARRHHPVLKAIYEARGEKPGFSEQAEEELKSCYENSISLWRGKTQLVERWLAEGLKLESVDRTTFLQESKALLVGIAREQGLPDDFFLRSFGQEKFGEESWWQMLKRALARKREREPTWQEKEHIQKQVDRLASEFFAAHFVDDAEELSLMRPGSIHLAWEQKNVVV